MPTQFPAWYVPREPAKVNPASAFMHAYYGTFSKYAKQRILTGLQELDPASRRSEVQAITKEMQAYERDWQGRVNAWEQSEQGRMVSEHQAATSRADTELNSLQRGVNFQLEQITGTASRQSDSTSTSQTVGSTSAVREGDGIGSSSGPDGKDYNASTEKAIGPESRRAAAGVTDHLKEPDMPGFIAGFRRLGTQIGNGADSQEQEDKAAAQSIRDLHDRLIETEGLSDADRGELVLAAAEALAEGMHVQGTGTQGRKTEEHIALRLNKWKEMASGPVDLSSAGGQVRSVGQSKSTTQTTQQTTSGMPRADRKKARALKMPGTDAVQYPDDLALPQLTAPDISRHETTMADFQDRLDKAKRGQMAADAYHSDPPDMRERLKNRTKKRKARGN